MDSTLIMILFYALLFGVMYMILIRPQKKQAQKAKDMLSQLKPGDHVVTIGGLHGVIEEVQAGSNTVVLDCDGIYLTFEKRAISRVESTPTVATDDGIVEAPASQSDTVILDTEPESDETQQ